MHCISLDVETSHAPALWNRPINIKPSSLHGNAPDKPSSLSSSVSTFHFVFLFLSSDVFSATKPETI